MIFKKLTMNNFRQFRGIQHIDFALGENESGKNITIIYGETGRGKTGILRAIMFCLYGDQVLSQDENVLGKEICLVNLTELESCKENRKPVDTYVELQFSHKNEAFILRRNIRGILDDNDKLLQSMGEVKLYHTKADGNTQSSDDAEDIKKRIEGILGINIKDYFLFDGEKMQRLTLANVAQRKDIAGFIRNLLNIGSLEQAIRVTHRVKKDLNDEIAKKATGEYGKILHILNGLDKSREGLKATIKDLDGEYSKCMSQKKQIDKKLEECKGILHLIQERDHTETHLKESQEYAKQLLAEMKSKTSKASSLLISKTIDRIFIEIDHKKQKGEIPSEIRKDLIEKIIAEHRCICGRDIAEGSDSHKQIVYWKNKAADYEMESSALDIWSGLNGLINQRDDVLAGIEAILQKYGSCNSQIEKFNKKIEELHQQIGASEIKDAAELEKTRVEYEKKFIKLEVERSNAQDNLKMMDVDYAQYMEKRKQLEKDEGIKNELQLRANLLEETHSALQSVYDEFTNESKKKLEKEANKYFEQLLDKEGRETLKRIVVNEDYSLQIVNRWGKAFLADISAGQRQIMSISFIAALAKVAAAEKILEMPLFMDTPFGRLSFEHRRNLINNLPNYCSQWILLATDTEFSKQESDLLRSSGRWGKFYQLDIKESSTIIKERDITDQSHLSEKLEEIA